MPYLIKEFKPLGIFVLIIIILAIGLNLFLKNYLKANYSDEKKEALISTPSQFRLLSEDPCASSIYGDPGGIADNYIKINLHCGKDNSSTNTLDAKSVSPDTYSGALHQLAKINSFEVGVIPQRIDKLGNLVSEGNDWKCFSGIDSEIKNFDEKVKTPVTMNCFYKFSDEEIKEYYETN